jgi:sulfoxide reductase heme-binding subunit YedZ
MDAVRRFLNSLPFLWLLLLLPAMWMLNAWRLGDLFYGEILHVTGELSARLMMLAMATTPFRLMFPNARWPDWLLHRRRYFGIAAFIYALLHAVVYLERKRDLSLILEEGAEFAMWTGWLAFVIFAALAATSNDASVRRLKRTWKKLHRYVYVAALLVFAHWIFAAFDLVPGLVHFAILLGLELYRLWKRGKLRSHAT